MARVIGIMGESGSGKTTAMRTLDPATTFYIDSDKKGLSWKGWREGYKQDINYVKTNVPELVLYHLYNLNLDEKGRAQIMKGFGKSPEKMTTQQVEMYKSFRTVVVDTVNGIMVGYEMKHIHEKGYDKWTDLASYAWNIMEYALSMREDLTVVLVFHSETVKDDFGSQFTRIKTNGRKLEKIVLESKLPVLLWATGMNSDYKLLTRANDCTCKAPLGAFEQVAVPNDMKAIIEALADF